MMRLVIRIRQSFYLHLFGYVVSQRKETLMEYPYRYETHLHTKQSSACSSCLAQDYIELYQKAGYTGIIVTDHFYHGNSGIPRNLSWRDWVDRFALGYEDAKREGDKRGFQVFFGWEENFDGDEYLIYGLSKEWLYEHEEVKTWTQEEQFQKVQEAGGLVVQAHPFRERDYLSKIHLHPTCVHAMEVANSGNLDFMDANAYEYCRKNHIIMTAGSDMHHAKDVSSRCFGMAFSKPLESIHDYVSRIKEAKNKVEKEKFLMNEKLAMKEKLLMKEELLKKEMSLIKENPQGNNAENNEMLELLEKDQNRCLITTKDRWEIRVTPKLPIFEYK